MNCLSQSYRRSRAFDLTTFYAREEERAFTCSFSKGCPDHNLRLGGFGREEF